MGKKNKYFAFSLVEMLITISLLGFIMMTVSVVLSTLIKVSVVSTNKIRARNESEFVLELIRRTVRNTNPTDLYLFNSLNSRAYNAEEERFVDKSNIIQNTYSLQNLVEEATEANEIHFKPYGDYHKWVCIGFFKSPPVDDEDQRGYLLMTSKESMGSTEHESCFGQADYLILLNSPYVNIGDFTIQYAKSGNMSYLILFDIEAEPVDWYLSTGAPIQRTVFRQGVVSTEGFVW